MGYKRLRAAILAVASLGQPQRLKLYEYVVQSPIPLGRDGIAEALNLKRSLVAFHLDKLVEDGFLEIEFRRLNDKAGPGAGRPSKLYFRSSNEFQVSTPERHYDLAAQLLAEGIEKATAAQIPISKGVELAAERYGQQIAAELHQQSKPSTAANVCGLLEDHGYEPEQHDGEIVMRNCPFHKLADDHRDLVCNMNLAIFEAIDTTTDIALNPHLQPTPGKCCVRLRLEE